MSDHESILYLFAFVLIGAANVLFYWLPFHLAEKRRKRRGAEMSKRMQCTDIDDAAPHMESL